MYLTPWYRNCSFRRKFSNCLEKENHIIKSKSTTTAVRSPIIPKRPALIRPGLFKGFYMKKPYGQNMI